MMEMAVSISKMSKDPSTKVGCVIVSPDKRRITTGYNGFPSDIPDYEDWWNNRDVESDGIAKYDICQHAEINAIIQARTNLQGWSLYCTHRPCLSCTGIIISSGIKSVYYKASETHMDLKTTKSSILFGIAEVAHQEL